MCTEGTSADVDHRRLAYYNLEIRDSYFSRLKTKIEQLRIHNKSKVVVCSHSYALTFYKKIRLILKNGWYGDDGECRCNMPLLTS